MENTDTAKNTDKNKSKKIKNIVIVSLLTVGVFSIGWLTGSGKIQIKSYNPVSQNESLPEELDLSSVQTIYKSIRQNFDGELNETELLDGIKEGLAKATGDPYTEYFNPDAADEFQGEIDGTFEGIGAELGKDADDNIIVVSPIAGYPAEEAGLMPKDIIAGIDDESAHDLTISEAVDKIRGEEGTDVKLTIVRDGKSMEISITRTKINIPSVEYEIKDNIGILTITRFGSDTVGLAKQAAEEFKAANVNGVVLDLRGNPGGYLEAAVDISSIWLDKGTEVLSEKRENVVIDKIEARGTAVLKGVNTVVLINAGSASASEIVAGALKDNNAATLIGTQSFGKGSVQQPISLKDGGLLKITIARWYTPAGNNIDEEGISPDKEVTLSAEDIQADRDPQMDAAITELN